ncbi:transcriptional regulator [Streptomyces sp. CB03238]|nr:transcriptional regulator [Streptomyces sp. CB03238]
MIERLRRVLDGMGYELGGPELLDILWLARAMDGGATREGDGAPAPTGGGRGGQPGPEPMGGDGPLTAVPPSEPLDSALPDRSRQPAGGRPARSHALFTADGAEGPAAGPRARAVRAPGPRALPGMQGLARALRPLRRHRDHRLRTVADIEATVRVTAESGVLDVIDRPEQELRHTAVLLVDDAPSMRVWQPLVRDVRRLLERGGVFRSVHVHRFDLREGHRPATTPRTESPLTFLVTDGVDAAWRESAAARFLTAWERCGPLVVLSPLPRRLWRGTAFDARPHLLVAGRPFARNGELGVLDPLDGATAERPAGRLPVPVAALSPASLGTWARLLTRPGAPRLLDTVLVADTPPVTAAEGDTPPRTPEQLLERFRASFSPDAYRLAVRLSAIRPLSAPVIQLVRIATLPGTTSAVVAEVLLGGLLQPLDGGESPGRLLPRVAGGDAGDLLYDFRPGVRELLAGGLSTEQSLDVVDAVGQALEPYLGRMPDFAALLADPHGSARLTQGTTAFAVLVSPVLDRLYGAPVDVAGDTVATQRRGVAAAPLRFTVFGPELARRGDEAVPMGPLRQRAVLVALLLREGRRATLEELIDALWGEDAPPSASPTVQAYLSRLRRTLAPSGFVIDRTPGGYRLMAEQADGAVPLDLTEAEGLHAAARSAQSSGDLAGARRLLGEAVELLRGHPLDGVPGPYAETQRTRLEEWRLTLVESRIELDLTLEGHAEVIPELTALTAAHPLREQFRALLMTAFYQAGQQVRALQVYADTRRLLRDELGLEPGPELRQLHQRIVDGVRPEDLRVSRRALVTPPPPATTPAGPPSEGLHFGVLGPVRAWRGSVALPSGSPQQRALLAVLLLREGRTTTAAEIIDAIWGRDAPSQALAAVRTYASRLRKVLDPGVLVSESGGYFIRVGHDALDLHVAHALASHAEDAREAGDPRRARELLNQCLGLWDGESLAGVPGPYAEAHRSRLEEWRLELLETRLDLDLEAGGHAEAVSELTALTARHPLRERLRELLMLALYRSGRQAEALAVYADTRRLLADELGVDPLPELSALQQRILRADADLMTTTAAAPERPATPARPSHLPATVPDFTGRSSFLQELADRLTSAAEAEGSVAAISSLAGIGGVGKTTLAVHVAHQVRPHFPDGQLYMDLQGAGHRAAEPETVLGAFLRSLGTPDSAIPDTLEERSALYRATLHGRRVLVVLDNARSAAQVRPLLPGTAGCATLITSRVRMVDLAGAHLIDLDVMSPEEALQLFTRIVGEQRVGAERAAALDVVASCGFLPLAIRIAASRLAARRTWTVSVLAAKLADERRRLDELQAGDLAVKATFELGYAQLEPVQARAFRLLGLADGPDISLAAAAAVLGLSDHEAEDLLESLVDASLLESAAPGRYRYHDLLRLYARACAERADNPPGEGETALSRLLDFYLSTAAGVYAIQHPGDRLVDHLEPTTHPGLSFADEGAALDWLFTEADCLLATVRRATSPSFLRRAVDTSWACLALAESGAASAPYERVVRGLSEAALQAGDAQAEGRALLCLAQAELVAGRFHEADTAATGAAEAARVSGDVPAAGWSADLRGTIALHHNRAEDAEAYYSVALDSFRADGDRPGEARVLCDLSRVHLARGRTSEALRLARQGVALYDLLGTSLRGANARYALGLALTQAARYDEATTVLRQARDIFHNGRQRMWEGLSFYRLAEVDLAAHRPAQAAAHAEQALSLLRGLGGEWRRANVVVVLGRALHALGQNDRARACWQEALTVYEELGSAEAGELRDLLANAATGFRST